MPLNLARSVTALVIGGGDGALRATMPTPAFTLGAEPIHWHLVAEAVALVGGGLMQFMAPYTLSNIVDGVVDGAAALLASNVTGRLIGGAGATTPYLQARRGVASRVSPYGVSSSARPAVGTVDTGVRRVLVQ